MEYKEFKKEMEERGHEVTKKRNDIVIKPNNNYLGYAQGFEYAEQVVEPYESYLRLKSWDHCNEWIYSMTFTICN